MKMGSSGIKQWCRRHYVTEQRLKEMAQLRHQLWRLMGEVIIVIIIIIIIIISIIIIVVIIIIILIIIV